MKSNDQLLSNVPEDALTHTCYRSTGPLAGTVMTPKLNINFLSMSLVNSLDVTQMAYEFSGNIAALPSVNTIPPSLSYRLYQTYNSWSLTIYFADSVQVTTAVNFSPTCTLMTQGSCLIVTDLLVVMDSPRSAMAFPTAPTTPMKRTARTVRT